jgi:hypothetical protein
VVTGAVQGGTGSPKIVSKESSQGTPETPYHPVPPSAAIGPDEPPMGASNGQTFPPHVCEANGSKTPGSVADWLRRHVVEVREWPPVGSHDDPGCLVASCGRSTFAVGLCRAHYKRAQRACRAELRRSRE